MSPFVETTATSVCTLVLSTRTRCAVVEAITSVKNTPCVQTSGLQCDCTWTSAAGAFHAECSVCHYPPSAPSAQCYKYLHAASWNLMPPHGGPCLCAWASDTIRNPIVLVEVTLMVLQVCFSSATCSSTSRTETKSPHVVRDHQRITLGCRRVKDAETHIF